MIHFQHPQILWFLLLIPACVGAWIWLLFRNKRRLEAFADRGMFGRLIPDASSWRPSTKFGLIMLGAAFLIIALANPQEGSKMVKGERLGSDIAICLDISNSMMAEDIQPNRLERSKRTVANLLNALGSDRISLVVFAGSSYVQMPLTSDYSAVKLFLDQIDCSLISAQGTAIGDAIDKAMETFGYGDPDREWVKNQGRAIVVISDGENFEDDAEAAARKAAAQNVRVCTIGMGLTEGTPIPEYRGGQRVGYKRDNSGNTVTTHLDEATLTAIAHAGKGIYVRANNINSGIQDIVKLIEGLEKDSFGETLFSEYESRYQYPLAAALLCLIAELLIFERRNKKFNLDNIMSRKTPANDNNTSTQSKQ
jgi:Ca-activated chloride channel family protein